MTPESPPSPVPAPPAAEPFAAPHVVPLAASVQGAVGLDAALDAAAGQVVAGWRSMAEDAQIEDEVRELTGALVGAIRSTMRGRDGAAAGLPSTPLTRRCLSLLRAGFLQQVAVLDPLPDSGALLRVLTALECLQHALEPNWAQHFADRLSGPDGLELVVEVAHDIRSPLTSVLFLAETLQRGQSGPVTPVQERQLGLIYSAAFGLSAMASDVIELARGGDRLVDLDPIPFSLRDILGSVRDIVHPIAEEKGIRVVVGGCEPDFRVGHPVALSRVLLNLTTNALKFTDEGEVEVSATAHGPDRVRFTVRDTGPGIPESAMFTLYEPFRRRNRQGEYSFSGTGLGLSIVRKLVEAMGGAVEVDTTAGHGTRFAFLLTLPPSRVS